LHLSAPATVSSTVFLTILWGGFILATFSLIFRILIRLRTFRGLLLDDIFIFLAWALFLAVAILWQLIYEDMYMLFALESGQLWPPPTDFLDKMNRYLRTLAVILTLFYSGVWSVKLSFLFFFRRLYCNITWMKYHWWAVLVITLGTFAACVATTDYMCLVTPIEEDFQQCMSTPQIEFEWTSIRVNCVMDVVSDACIISIPMAVLWQVRIAWRRKIALGAFFCLAVITMVVAVVRIAVVSSAKTDTAVQVDSSWLYLWENIELAIAIMIACLASFRILFTFQSAKKSTPKTYSDFPSSRKRSGPMNITQMIDDIVGDENADPEDVDDSESDFSTKP